MLVTGKPVIVLGMVTATGPAYPVMVMVPLLVVKVNCGGRPGSVVNLRSSPYKKIDPSPTARKW
jgi:hypothetical protein